MRPLWVRDGGLKEVSPMGANLTNDCSEESTIESSETVCL